MSSDFHVPADFFRAIQWTLLSWLSFLNISQNYFMRCHKTVMAINRADVVRQTFHVYETKSPGCRLQKYFSYDEIQQWY
jgi:hypothetical protein